MPPAGYRLGRSCCLLQMQLKMELWFQPHWSIPLLFFDFTWGYFICHFSHFFTSWVNLCTNSRSWIVTNCWSIIQKNKHISFICSVLIIEKCTTYNGSDNCQLNWVSLLASSSRHLIDIMTKVAVTTWKLMHTEVDFLLQQRDLSVLTYCVCGSVCFSVMTISGDCLSRRILLSWQTAFVSSPLWHWHFTTNWTTAGTTCAVPALQKKRAFCRSFEGSIYALIWN